MFDPIKIQRNLMNNKILKRLVPKHSLEEVQDYWQNQNIGDKNAFTDYLNNFEGSEIFVSVVKKYLPNNNDARVLEIGSNVGRNLNAMLKNGYMNLSGIEINSNAVEAMKTHYPELAKKVRIYNTTVEEKIREFADNEFVLVFTVAVLMNIHSESEWIFSEMVRIAKKFIIIFEDETGNATKNFPRDYKKIFENLGMKQIQYIDSLPHWRPIYKTRIFKKSSSPE